MENLTIKRNVIRGYPYYLVYKENYKGVVFNLHGLTSKDSEYLNSAIKIALNGYLVVLPLAKWHGEQKPNNFNNLFNGDNFLNSMTAVMNDYLSRVSKILDYLVLKGYVKDLKVGCSGFSMGAYVTYLLPLFDKRFKTIVPISGSPYFYDKNAVKHFNISNTKNPKLARMQAADNEDYFKDLNILIIHNKDDETVSYLGSERFYNNLRSLMNKGEIKLILNEKGGHNYYSYMDEEIISWFNKYL